MSFDEDRFMMMAQYIAAKSIAQKPPHIREKILKQFAAAEQGPGGKYMQQACQLYLTHKEEHDAIVKEEAEAAPANAETAEPYLDDEEYAKALLESISTPEHLAAVFARNPDLMKGYAKLGKGKHAHLIKQAIALAEVAVKVPGDGTNVTPLFGKKKD